MKRNKSSFPNPKVMLLVWGSCVLLVLLVTSVSVLLSFPTPSSAGEAKYPMAFLDPTIALATVVIPITFLFILITRPRRHR